MPPAGESYRVTNAGNTEPLRDGHRVVFRRPDLVLGNLALEAKPLGAWRTVPPPIEPGVIGEDLDARADDEHQEEQVKKMEQSQPQREARVHRPGGRSDAGATHEEFLYAGHRTQLLGDGDPEDE